MATVYFFKIGSFIPESGFAMPDLVSLYTVISAYLSNESFCTQPKGSNRTRTYFSTENDHKIKGKKHKIKKQWFLRHQTSDIERQ